MNIEIFSLRTSKQDVENINNNLRNISESLAKDGFYVKYKTLVDLNKQKIKKALDASAEAESKPDVIIAANALTSHDSSSFKNLFADIIAEHESEIQDPAPKKSKKSKNPEENKYYIKKIKIFSMGDLGNNYNGYCFTYKGMRVITLPKTDLTGKETPDLFSQGVLKATEIFENNEELYPNGINFIEGKPKKKSLAKRIFPNSSDSSKEKARKSASLIAFCVFFVTAVLLLYNLVYLPMQNKAIQSEIQTIAYGGESNDSVDDGTDIKTKDWDALSKINKDIVGWIKMDNTVIDYPVLRDKDDDENYQFYLKHTYKKDYSEYGSIFVDYRCTKGTKSKNVILHGHHMDDGSMFGNLMNYGTFSGDLDFYKKTPTITFDTPDGDATYKIISVFKTNALSIHGEFFNYMIGDFNSDSEFMNFVYNIRVRSLINCPVSVNEEDTLLTLSTCSYEFTDFRTVVVARKVRIGEDPKVDVSKASLNKNPVWPDVYYSRYGGTRPKVTTFKTAYKAGQIDWYDGAEDPSKLKGKEELPTKPAETEPTTNEKGETNPTQPTTVKKYKVTFIDFDGNVLKTEMVEKGKAATPPTKIPQKSDDYYDYIFKGWQIDDYKNVQSDMIVAGKYDPVLKEQ